METSLATRPRIFVAAACLLLVLQFVVFLRTRWVEDESWISDEAWTLVQQGTIRMPIFPADPRSGADTTPPVYPRSLAASFALFGLGIPQARLLSLLASLALVIVVFRLATDIAGPFCGSVAALLMATDNFVLVTMRTARPEPLTALLVWAALFFCYRAVRSDSMILGLASGAMCGLGMTCHPLAAPFFGLVGLFYLVHYGRRFWRAPVVWAFSITAVQPVVVYVAWCFSDAAHIACFRNMYVNAAVSPFRERLLGEADRWADFIGLGSQRVSLPFRVPLRLHVILILLAAFVFVCRVNRRLALVAGAIFLVNFAWFLYMVNKGPRYLVLLSPLFAILLGYWAAKSQAGRWRWAASAAVGLVLLTQAAGNAYWLYKYRVADYPRVAEQLRRIVPPGASVYGITTFWLALNDRTYYAYDRTPFQYAITKLHPQYLILHDRVMDHGSGHGVDDFVRLRQQATDFVSAHGTLAGRVSNDFYGDLEIYRIFY
jgi:4-amino-4-deoxy-L-arabinose transferase-like glycosyltransferase